MIVSQEQLDHWRAYFGRVQQVCGVARRDLAAGRTHAVDSALAQTEESARRMAIKLEQAGAQRSPGMPLPPETPLHLLGSPANVRYAQKLREAWEAGLAVDRERYGEMIGTDGEAQAVELILRDVEMEVAGPVGLVRE